MFISLDTLSGSRPRAAARQRSLLTANHIVITKGAVIVTFSGGPTLQDRASNLHLLRLGQTTDVVAIEPLARGLSILHRR